MIQNWKKTLKRTIIILGLATLGVIIFVSLYIAQICIQQRDIVFDKDKLIASTANICVVDTYGNLMNDVSAYGKPIAKIQSLNKNTTNAFVAIEDKNFYKHNGINVKRMIKALLTNIKSGYAKEGASTISQQTIKNSHLTNEKTISRKVKEIFLTLQLEKNFTKDEILEIYLNIIYFGNGCFGIEQASQTYFDKSAEELTLEESATLAGIIKSPKTYSPISNKTKCITRRNLVLEEMLKSNFISQDECNYAKNQNLVINKNFNTAIQSTQYEQLALNEASEILDVSEKEIQKSNYIIQTYFDKDFQNIVDASSTENIKLYQNGNKVNDHCIMLNDTHNGGILAIKNFGNIDIFATKRQPASLIKPILVYAPCLEEKIISISSIINDEKVDFDGYSPQNSYKSYLGNITATTALAKSSNVCSVRLLNCLGIDKAKQYAEKIGISFDSEDNHLALALGAMKNGTTLAELSSAYSCFANNGIKNKLTFIKKIIDEKGNIIYEHKSNKNKVLSEETCFLMTQMLKECSLSGTNKKLSTLQFIPASKTGTNGSGVDSKNLDGYNISYSPDVCLNVWCGNLSGNNENNLSNEYAGGNYNAILARSVWEKLEKTKSQNEFSIPPNIKSVDLDTIDLYENNKLTIASDETPERFRIKSYVKFDQNLPVSKNFVIPSKPKLEYKINDTNIELKLDCLSYLTYNIYQKNNDNIILVDKIKHKGKLSYELAKPNCVTEFYVVAEYNNITSNTIIQSEKSNIIQFCP